MGTIYKMQCKCGYQVELNVGQGIAAFHTGLAKKLFGEESYELYENSKDISSNFQLANELCLCPNCRELLSQATFTYKDRNGLTIKTIKECSRCGKIPQLVDDTIYCPKCGAKVELSEDGHWD